MKREGIKALATGNMKEAVLAGTQFTCFTGTKVQILTQDAGSFLLALL